MTNSISWFEIPVKNFEAAKAFYETVMDVKLEIMEMKDMGAVMGVFPADMENGGISGSIISGPGNSPSQEGSLIYLNGGEDLSVPLGRVEKAGGTVVVPKTSIGSNGFFAQFLDTEGNRVALHSNN